MQATDLASALKDYTIRSSGTQATNVLLQGDETRADNYRLSLSYATEDMGRQRRHKHNFDQIRFAIEGEFVYAPNKVLAPGEIGYFPEGAPYGPQLNRKGLRLLICQFGGASGNGLLSLRQRRAGFEALKAYGEFGGGVFVHTDATGKRRHQDSFEAVWEHVSGRKLAYPLPRYDGPIVLDPKNFGWLEESGSPGIQRKWLGAFTERFTRVGFVKMERRATLAAGMHDSAEILFLVSGAVRCNGHSYLQHSAFGFEPREGAVPIVAEEDSELFCIQMPRFR